jgi:hypothetical protein
LTHRPACLLALLLALNAFARPYGGLLHDARLYSMQVLNQLEGGTYADDLFLRYGSQDQFSIFSRMVAPVVGVFGLHTAFFLLYLAFTALFHFALMRFVLVLIEDRVVAVLALVFLAVSPLPFGGLKVFNVQESFLTPRILTNALVLFALERTLKERWGTALAGLVPAMFLHPIMAFGGLLIWAGCFAVACLRRNLNIALSVGCFALGATALAYEPLGARVFGLMDADWRAMVLDASAYNFPSQWAPQDWINVAVSIAVPIWAAGSLPHHKRARRRFLYVAAAAGIAGTVGTSLAAELPYALLFQGQPYRVLWILKVLQVPLGFWLIRRWAGAAELPRRLTALGLLFYFSLTVYAGSELLLPVIVLAFMMLRAWVLAEDISRHWWRLTAVSIIVAALAWSAYKWLILVQFRDQLLYRIDAYDYAQRFVEHLGPVFWLIAATALVIELARLRVTPARFAGGLAGLALLCQATLFVVSNTTAYREGYTRFGADVTFVRDHLVQRHITGAPLPTVYSDWGRVDHVWVDLHTKSYFDWAQVVGVLFNKQTAAEGRRRAALVAPFAMDRLREEGAFIPAVFRDALGRLHRLPLDCAEATEDDVARLCREPGLDYVILKQEFPGLVAAGNGRVFIYDCHQVRAVLLRPGSSPALAAARPGHPASPPATAQ